MECFMCRSSGYSYVSWNGCIPDRSNSMQCSLLLKYSPAGWDLTFLEVVGGCVSCLTAIEIDIQYNYSRYFFQCTSHR